MSVSGVNPCVSPELFESIVDACQGLGIARAHVADALAVNGPELLGGSLALAGSLLIGKRVGPVQLSFLSGAYVITALASGNPLLMPVAAGGLAYSLVEVEDKREVLVQAGKGALTSGGALLAASLVGGPMWVGCLTAVMAGVAVKYALDRPEQARKRVKETAEAATAMMRRGARHPRTNGIPDFS